MDHDERLRLHERSYSQMTAPSYSHHYSTLGMPQDARRDPGDPCSPSSSVPAGYVSSRIAPPGSAASYLYGPSVVPDSTSMSSLLRPSHHHHHLPEMGRPSSSMLGEGGQDPPNLVGKEGMPSPARRPQRPRIKFTQEEDELLIELKEKKNLSWKQIADFFPGRNPGTLQVRYCTRLKTEGTSWTREMLGVDRTDRRKDERLLDALKSYEDEKWRIVAQRVGGGVTPLGCCDRVWELFNDDLDDASQFSFTNES